MGLNSKGIYMNTKNRRVKKQENKIDKKKIKISIIIPCYNQEKYIEECLNSILVQKLNEFEIICVNDGSTDNTLMILNQYAKKDKRIKIINFKENKGTSQARKDGVLNSCGEYVMFIDPDDTFEKTALETAYINIKKFKVDILQFGINVINCGVNSSACDQFIKKAEPFLEKLNGAEVFFSCFKLGLFNFNLWNKIYNGELVRKAFKNINDGYYPKAQDMYAFFIIAYFAKSYNSIKSKLYNYYFGRGITGKRSISLERFSKIGTQMQIIEQLFKFIDNNAKENHSDYLEVLKFRGEIFYREVIANFNYIQDINENYLQALNILLDNLTPCISQAEYNNTYIYNSYISFLFEIFYDLLFKKNFKYELRIYDKLIEIFYDNNLSGLNINHNLYYEIKLLAEHNIGDKIIPIVFATNDNYAPYLSVAIQSINENTNKDCFYDIYVFHTSLSIQNQLVLKSMRNSNLSIRFVNVLPYIENLRNYSHSHYSIEMYYRLLIPEILFKYHKVIYLDCDLIVNKDVAELFKIDILDNIIAAVTNKIYSDYMKKYVENTLNLVLDKYFNSGVLIINTKKFNEEHIKEKCFTVLNETKKLMCPDQDILNIVCKDRCYYLPIKWNFQNSPNNFSLQETYEIEKNIIHFTSGFKPWNSSNILLAEVFWRVARMTPYYESILTTYLNSVGCFDTTKNLNTEVSEKVRNIINSNYTKKSIISWPFRMAKKFFRSVENVGLKKTMPKIKTKLSYVINRLVGKVDKYNNIIQKNSEHIFRLQNDISVSEYPKYLQEWYYEKTGVKFDIENPKSLSEKIQWLKIYDASIKKSHLSDKWLAKEYVKSVIGEKYIIKTYGVYDKFEDIDFSVLPSKFVIKSTHGSGQIIIVNDKLNINVSEIKQKITKWLSSSYAFHSGFEMHYLNIIPRIIIEEYVEGINNDLYDYKVMCFNGTPQFIWVDTDRFTKHKRTLFDLNWNKLPIKYNYETSEKTIPKPTQLKELLKLSKILAKDFSLCRCDFYVLRDGNIKFGELTFTSCSGIDRFEPCSFDFEIGKKLKLPSTKTQFKKYSKNKLLAFEKKFLRNLLKK